MPKLFQRKTNEKKKKEEIGAGLRRWEFMSLTSLATVVPKKDEKKKKRKKEIGTGLRRWKIGANRCYYTSKDQH